MATNLTPIDQVKNIARLLGVPDSELEGKTNDEIIEITAKANDAVLTKAKTQSELGGEAVFIDNYQKQLAKLKEDFKTPFEIWVAKIGAKETRTKVPVIGYNPETSEVIILYNKKHHAIKDNHVIKSLDELAATKAERKKNEQAK
jgi:hypothetical protein